MRVILISAAIILGAVVIAGLGLRFEPPPFPTPDLASAGTGAPFALSPKLPAPVHRFYSVLYGDQIPTVSSAIISGRARLRVAGISFPARFRFIHAAGEAYRHYIELTFFGFPIMRVNESYLSGAARLELPFGVTEGEPKTDQAANLALWAESVWLAPVLLTDPRVHWQPMDDLTARLVVPFGETEQQLIVQFDEKSHLPRFALSMRYKEATSADTSLWINEFREWRRLGERLTPTEAAVTWYEDGSPWAVFRVEEVLLNRDVQGYVSARGP